MARHDTNIFLERLNFVETKKMGNLVSIGPADACVPQKISDLVEIVAVEAGPFVLDVACADFVPLFHEQLPASEVTKGDQPRQEQRSLRRI